MSSAGDPHDLLEEVKRYLAVMAEGQVYDGDPSVLYKLIIDLDEMGSQLLRYDRLFRPMIFCLCGSTRFKEDYEAASMTLTLQGHIVLMPGFFPHADEIPLQDDVRASWEKGCLAKIDLADVLYIVNPGNYIGDHTSRMIQYAKNVKKEIIYYEDHPEPLPQSSSSPPQA